MAPRLFIEDLLLPRSGGEVIGQPQDPLGDDGAVDLTRDELVRVVVDGLVGMLRAELRQPRREGVGGGVDEVDVEVVHPCLDRWGGGGAEKGVDRLLTTRVRACD